MLQRRHVQIADQHGARGFLAAAPGEHGLHLAQEIELVGEFLVLLRIGNVATGRHIEIVQFEPVLELDREMAGVVLAAELECVRPGEGQPREDGHAVIALLAVNGLVDIARLAEGLAREEVVDDLGFLQAEHVRLLLLEQLQDQLLAQADRVDVPGGELHRGAFLLCTGRRSGAEI